MSENILKVDSRPSKQLHAWVKIKPGSTRIKFQVDTCATCNLIRRSDLPNAVRINKSEKTALHYYNGTKNESLGSCQLTLETQDGKTSEQQFQVVTNGATSLIGARAAQEMSIISVNKECIATVTKCQSGLIQGGKPAEKMHFSSFINRFPNVFQREVGCLDGVLHLN